MATLHQSLEDKGLELTLCPDGCHYSNYPIDVFRSVGQQHGSMAEAVEAVVPSMLGTLSDTVTVPAMLEERLRSMMSGGTPYFQAEYDGLLAPIIADPVLSRCCEVGAVLTADAAIL